VFYNDRSWNVFTTYAVSWQEEDTNVQHVFIAFFTCPSYCQCWKTSRGIVRCKFQKVVNFLSFSVSWGSVQMLVICNIFTLHSTHQTDHLHSDIPTWFLDRYCPWDTLREHVWQHENDWHKIMSDIISLAGVACKFHCLPIAACWKLAESILGHDNYLLPSWCSLHCKKQKTGVLMWQQLIPTPID